MENYDEGVYSEISREMSMNNDYFTLSYQHQPFYEKPPLYIWASVPLVKIFGDANWTFRFWAAMAGIASAVLLGIFVFKKEKNIAMAWIVSSVFITGGYSTLHLFISGDTDAFLIFFSILGFYSYWKGLTNKKWLLVMGAAFALAVMSKSVAGLAGPGVLVVESLLNKRWDLYKNKFLWLGIGLFFLILAPWHIAMTVLHGKAFWSSYIGFHVIERSLDQIFPTKLPLLWYFKVVYSRLYPFSFIIPLGLLFGIWQFIKGKKEYLILLLWAILPFIAYTLAVTKFEQYILICYPPFIWLMASFIIWVYEKIKDKRKIILAIFIFGLFLAVFYRGYNDFRALQAKPKVSTSQEIANIVKDTKTTRVIMYDTLLYSKPAAYFELARIVPPLEIINAKNTTQAMSSAQPGSVVILSDTTDSSIISNLEKKSVVKNYAIYLKVAD